MSAATDASLFLGLYGAAKVAAAGLRIGREMELVAGTARLARTNRFTVAAARQSEAYSGATYVASSAVGGYYTELGVQLIVSQTPSVSIADLSRLSRRGRRTIQ